MMLDFQILQQRTDEALLLVKKKEKQLLDTTAELNWAKSALKSGEVKDML